MGKYDNFVKIDHGKMNDDDSRFAKRGGKRFERLKIQVGSPRVIRFLRAPTDPSFYRIRSQHWGIPVGHGNTPPLLCARKHDSDGERCYFCEAVNDLFNNGDPNDRVLANRTKANVSVISNVIDVKDPVNADGTPKVLIWQYSWKVFQEIRAYFRDSDYGDLTHPETGRNFRVTASVVSSQGDRKWTRYDLQVGAQPTELEVPEALDHLYDIDASFPVKLYSYAEQKMIWDGTWDPRSGTSPALPGPVATGSHKPEKVEFKTALSVPEMTKSQADAFRKKIENPKPNMADWVEKAAASEDEFESAASKDDDWEDILDDVDDDKQKAIRAKLDALKKAAKK